MQKVLQALTFLVHGHGSNFATAEINQKYFYDRAAAAVLTSRRWKLINIFYDRVAAAVLLQKMCSSAARVIHV